MFARKLRLPPNIKFSQSKYYSSQFFTFKIVLNNVIFNRYGFIVSKNISKKAVVRNRLKRKLRSYVEKFSHKLKNGFDMLFVVKKKFLKKDEKQLLNDVEDNFKTTKILE